MRKRKSDRSGDADAMRHVENHQPYKMYFVVQALTAWTGIEELKELKTLENCCDLTTPGIHLQVIRFFFWTIRVVEDHPHKEVNIPWHVFAF